MSILHILGTSSPFSFVATIIITPVGGEPIRMYYTIPGPVSMRYDMNGDL